MGSVDMGLLEIVVLGSLFTWGINKTLQPGQVFGSLGKLIPDDRWFTKPLKSCIPCMSSVYGSILFWVFYFIGAIDLPVFFYICFVFMVTGLNYFMICLIPD